MCGEKAKLPKKRKWFEKDKEEETERKQTKRRHVAQEPVTFMLLNNMVATNERILLVFVGLLNDMCLSWLFLCVYLCTCSVYIILFANTTQHLCMQSLMQSQWRRSFNLKDEGSNVCCFNCMP